LALGTKLKKTKVLYEMVAVKDAMAHELVVPVSNPSSNHPLEKAQSRVLSSKVLAEEVHTVINDLKKLVLPSHSISSEAAEQGESKIPIKKVKVPLKPAISTVATIEALPKPEETDDHPDDHDSDNTSDRIEDVGWESGTVNDEEEELDEEWESGSISEASDAALSASVDGGDEQIPIPKTNSSKSVPKAVAPSKPGSKAASSLNSTFLPSLSVGYIRASDDSDFSDSEAKIADLETKKNRRGQRARRA
jgi:hypothetical protein